MIRPIRDLLYILPLVDREKIGSIYVPQANLQRPDQGIVKYRGPKTSGEIKVGTHVIFSGYDGTEIVTEDDGTLLIMPESFIVGVHENDHPAYLFTKEQLDALIDKAYGDTLVRGEQHRITKLTAHYFKEKLRSLIHDHFFSELYY